jgi:hypothetical protein
VAKYIPWVDGGYSPYNYWKAYFRWAPVFKPDVVIIGLSPDDYDCRNEDSQYLIEDGATLAVFRKGQTPKKGGGSSIRKLRKWLSWNSEFYVLMRNFLYYNDLVGQVSMWMSAKAEEQNSQSQQFEVPKPENMKKAWAKTRASKLAKFFCPKIGPQDMLTKPYFMRVSASF